MLFLGERWPNRERTDVSRPAGWCSARLSRPSPARPSCCGSDRRPQPRFGLRRCTSHAHKPGSDTCARALRPAAVALQSKLAINGRFHVPVNSKAEAHPRGECLLSVPRLPTPKEGLQRALFAPLRHSGGELEADLPDKFSGDVGRLALYGSERAVHRGLLCKVEGIIGSARERGSLSQGGNRKGAMSGGTKRRHVLVVPPIWEPFWQ